MKNKTLLWIRLGILILIFITVLGISSSLILNKGWSGRYMINFNGWGNWGEPDLLHSNSFSYIKKLNIDSISYAVHIEEHDSDIIILEEYISDNAEENEIYSKDQTLYFKQHKSFGALNIDFGKIVIKVPRNSKLDYNINSVSGSVQVSVQSQSLDINTVSGSVKVYNLGEALTADTISGSVKVYQAYKHISI